MSKVCLTRTLPRFSFSSLWLYTVIMSQKWLSWMLKRSRCWLAVQRMHIQVQTRLGLTCMCCCSVEIKLLNGISSSQKLLFVHSVKKQSSCPSYKVDMLWNKQVVKTRVCKSYSLIVNVHLWWTVAHCTLILKAELKSFRIMIKEHFKWI